MKIQNYNVELPDLLNSETSALSRNCQQPKLKQGSCWLPCTRLHATHPNAPEPNVRHYSTGPGIRLPDVGSLLSLSPTGRLWLPGWNCTLLSRCGAANKWERDRQAWRHHRLQSFFSCLLLGTPSQCPRACLQSGPSGTGQVMRIKPSIFAYPPNREGN